MNKLTVLFFSLILCAATLFQNCEKNPFDSPQPGRLALNLKLATGPYENFLIEDDRLEVIIQYVKGYVDSTSWSYIVDMDSFKVINLFNIDDDSNVLAETIIDTVWIDSLTFTLDTVSTTEPIILSDSKGVKLPPLTYKFLKIKAVLQDTFIVLGGKNFRIQKKTGTESIADVDLNLTIEENEWIEKNLLFDLKNSIEKSTSEPDLYFYHPHFIIE